MSAKSTTEAKPAKEPEYKAEIAKQAEEAKAAHAADPYQNAGKVCSNCPEPAVLTRGKWVFCEVCHDRFADFFSGLPSCRIQSPPTQKMH
jgi:hypothetical protein